MLTITDGVIRDSRVTVVLVPAITHGPLNHIDAIVVHQTDSSTATGTIAGWRSGGGTGAHLLIDKDGTMYQTVPFTRMCWHVAPIQSKCLAIHSCAESDIKKYGVYKKTSSLGAYIRKVGSDELKKPYPSRYPGNIDSVGIEIVGRSLTATTYEPVTSLEQRSLDWLISELLVSLKLTRTDIYRHPPIAYKNPGEASSAQIDDPLAAHRPFDIPDPADPKNRASPR